MGGQKVESAIGIALGWRWGTKRRGTGTQDAWVLNELVGGMLRPWLDEPVSASDD